MSLSYKYVKLHFIFLILKLSKKLQHDLTFRCSLFYLYAPNGHEVVQALLRALYKDTEKKSHLFLDYYLLNK